MAENKLIIDTDAGIDDAIALMMAFDFPDTDVIGITAVSGNVGVDFVVRNVRLVLNLLGKNVPVFRGAAAPLFRETINSSGLMGEDGLGGASEKYPAPTQDTPGEAAACALVRLAREVKKPDLLTIVALGPLTNLALAVRLDPGIVSKVDHLVIMGGAMEGRGNITPAAEYNFYADPEAAAIIFEAEFQKLQVVPWETSVRAMISWQAYDHLTKLATQASDFFYHITKNIKKHLEGLGLPGMPLPDPITLASTLDSRIIIGMENVPITVETNGIYGRGLMAVDWQRTMQKKPNAQIITDVNQDIFLELLQNSLKAH
jgi:purine nucleosidase